MTQWVALWRTCHSFVQGAAVRTGFPDGRPLDRQDALLVNMFGIIGDEFAKEVAQQAEDSMKGGKR